MNHMHLQPRDYHPVFFMGAGNSQNPVNPVHVQASILLHVTAGVKEPEFIFDLAKKPVESIDKNLDIARSVYVLVKERGIICGGWRDVALDEVDVGNFVDTSIQRGKNTPRAQWEV